MLSELVKAIIINESCQRIDALYLLYLQVKYQSDHVRFFKAQLPSDKTDRTPVITREQAHKDLREVYEGDSESESDAYESDLEFS